MTVWLKQSTAVTIKLGPFADQTDGFTAETGLTIAQADIRLSKNGGDIAQTNNATGATHDELGYYDIPLNTTDTNTLGVLLVAVSESGALPVWQYFMVVPANVWDSLFGADTLIVEADSGSLAAIANAVWDEPLTQPSGVFAWAGNFRNLLNWLGALSRNKILQTNSESTLRNDADDADLATSVVSDDGSTFVRSEWT